MLTNYLCETCETNQTEANHVSVIWYVMAQMKLWELGFQHVAGVDEAGRGPLAGPVVAAACIIPASVIIPGKISNFCVMASGLDLHYRSKSLSFYVTAFYPITLP
jgi:hypothetical protein